MGNIKKALKYLFTFKEPEKIEKFILEEKDSETAEHLESISDDQKENGLSKKDSEKNKQDSNKNYDKDSDADTDEDAGADTDEDDDADTDEDTDKSTDNDNEKSGNSDPKKGGIKSQFAPIKQIGGKKNKKEEKCECEDKEDKKQKEKASKKDISAMTKVSKKLSDNVEYLKNKYTVPDSADVVIREFNITVKDKSIPTSIVFIDGLINTDLLDMAILQPLMLLSNMEIKDSEEDIEGIIKNRLLPHNQIKIKKDLSEIVEDVNFGGCGIFVDGLDIAFTADIKGWKGRGVDRPNTEMIIRGPQEGFNESLRTNTGLIRKILKDASLVVENITVGKRSKTPCSLLYIKDIVNDSLVKEVRRRLKGIKIDYLFDSGELEQLLEDSSFLAVPQIIATERPDRVATMLTEGKVAVIVQGSPFALVMPATHIDLFHSAEDSYIRFPYANLLRIIRLCAITMSLLLPGLYVAITNFHHEMIPTDLLFAIEASRERVPFPSLVEILIMEFAFEFIREAGVRIPGPLGSTLGIIGGLILGQAAVAANIVSPILIIIVAVTGIGSFAIPNFSLGYAYRILRFVYIFLGSMAGFFGITAGLFLQGMWLASAKSFGVPFLAPLGPFTRGIMSDQILRGPIWKQEKRPDFLNVKKVEKQPKISRQWTEDDKKKKR